METFLRRTYGLKTPGETSQEPVCVRKHRAPPAPQGGGRRPVCYYPFWDYRCRRGSSSPVSPTLSSYSSSEGTSILTGDTDDLHSLMTYSDDSTFPPPLPFYHRHHHEDQHDVDTMTSLPTSEAETVTMGVSELASFLEADSLLLGDAEKMTLQLWAEDPADVGVVEGLYQPLFDSVVSVNCGSKHKELYNVCQWPESEALSLRTRSDIDDESSLNNDRGHSLGMPSLSVVVFLREEPITGEDTWAKMKEHFSAGSWRFHHSEAVSRGKLHAYENNSQDYLIARENMPLCAMRQIHCGKRILRFMRFVSAENWKDNVNLYSLLLAKDPDVLKQDFCLYTASNHSDYDVQLALKKIPDGIHCKPTEAAALCFRISQVGHTVPLLPNICTPVSDDRWRTTDLDGNVIFLDVVRMRDRSCEPVPELSECDLISHHFTPKELMQHSTPQGHSKGAHHTGHYNHHLLNVRNHRVQEKVHDELRPDEKYGTQHCADNNVGSGVNILEYDSLDELELLISDIASNCSEAINIADFTSGDYVKISDRDACGAVDGSSYHSEGNHEDQQLSPSPVSKTKPPVPPKPSMILKGKPEKLHSDQREDVHNSSSSSSKSEFLEVNKLPPRMSQQKSPELKGILLHNEPVLQIPAKSSLKVYQEPGYWAGLSESKPSQISQKYLPGSYKAHHATFKEDNKSCNNQDTRSRIDSSPNSRGSSPHTAKTPSPQPKPSPSHRPRLPTYDELQKKNKSKFQQYQNSPQVSSSGHLGSNSRHNSRENLLYIDGGYIEVKPPINPKNSMRTSSNDYLPMHSPSGSSCSNSSAGHSQSSSGGGKGLQVSSHPKNSSDNRSDTTGDHQISPLSPAKKAPPPYRPPPTNSAVTPAASATMVINRMPPSYTAAACSISKKQEQVVSNIPLTTTTTKSQDAISHNSSSKRPQPASSGPQRFRFDGATMPRFGRNSKLRQSVMPPPCFDTRDYSDSYEEQAIDVPGTAGVYTEGSNTKRTNVDSSTLGFYV